MFEGLRVVDLSRVLAGPFVTQMLSELGADVIKIEPAPGGDVARQLPFVRSGRSGYFIQINRGKRSVCIDMRQQRGRDLVRALALTADVVVENFRPGVLDSLGIGWPALHAAEPRLVLCSISAFGYGGPLSSSPGYDMVGAALSGVTAVTGDVGRPPALPNTPFGDTLTAAFAMAGIGAALYRRSQTGKGDWVQASLLDSYFSCHDVNIQAFVASDGAFIPGPTGHVHPTVCPIGFFQSGGRSVYMACVAPRDWGRLTAAMGRADVGADPGFATNEQRVARAPEVYALVEQWFAEVNDADRAVEILEAHGIVAQAVLTVPEAIAHPHNVARQAVRTVPDDVWGEATIPGPPVRFASVPTLPPLRAPVLGAHNRSVLAEVLHLSDAEIDDLDASGVLAHE